MFVDTSIAARIERVEAETTRGIAAAVVASGRAGELGFVREVGDGVAAYVRAGSPMNKVIALGLDTPIDQSALGLVEEALRARREAARIELSTLALPEAGAWLTARGYRLLGFENVLVRPLSEPPAPGVSRAPGLRVDPVSAATVTAWRDTTVEAFAVPDGTGLPVDGFSRAAIATVIDDVLECHQFDRYLASIEGVVVGAASMRVQDGVASLTGSATLREYRRRGVQGALIEARLAEARARGATLATITTAPGSQSQANVMRHGFALGYARAILVREFGDPALGAGG